MIFFNAVIPNKRICWLYIYGYLKLQVIAATSQPKNLYPKLYEGQYSDTLCLLTACLPFSLSAERHLGGSIRKESFRLSQ